MNDHSIATVDLSADLRRIADIEAACFPYPWTEEELADAIKEEGVFSRVLMVDDEIVAFLIYENNEDSWYVVDLAVHPDHQRKGWARKLLEPLLWSGRDLTIHVQVGSEAVAFYEYLGFETVDHVQDFYWNYPKGEQDALFMKRVAKGPCLACGHSLEDHATGRHRSLWFCEAANCDCDDFVATA